MDPCEHPRRWGPTIRFPNQTTDRRGRPFIAAEPRQLARPYAGASLAAWEPCRWLAAFVTRSCGHDSSPPLRPPVEFREHWCAADDVRAVQSPECAGRGTRRAVGQAAVSAARTSAGW